MELRHLRYFEAVAQELHFGRAAKNLNIAQPALSQAIKQLEEEIQVTLFYRSKREVKLSEAGEVFLNRTKQILRNVVEACEEAKIVQNKELGQIKIGFAGFIVSDLLPSILREFQIMYPNVRIYLKHLTSSEQLKAIKNGEIDAGILIPPFENNSLKILNIRKEPFVAAVPKIHKLAASKGPINLNYLEDEPFIIPPKSAGSIYYNAVLEICAEAGFIPNIVQEQQDLQTLTSLIAGGVGVSILPKSIKVFNENVVFLDIYKNKKSLTTAVAWNPAIKSEALDFFIDLIRERANV